ncbi:hypothetical protein [Dactylococcopsis salina]|uniref:hypothetical protein n=1 Tax=Dactylococcopsis salina TaxID=292566 RepID=UPI0002E937A6|nr:hypothetical protein [Dactylococcopsis salina]
MGERGRWGRKIAPLSPLHFFEGLRALKPHWVKVSVSQQETLNTFPERPIAPLEQVLDENWLPETENIEVQEDNEHPCKEIENDFRIA